MPRWAAQRFLTAVLIGLLFLAACGKPPGVTATPESPDHGSASSPQSTAQGGSGTTNQGGSGTTNQGGSGTTNQGGSGTTNQGGSGTTNQGGSGTTNQGGLRPRCHCLGPLRASVPRYTPGPRALVRLPRSYAVR